MEWGGVLGRRGTEGHCLCSQTWLSPRGTGAAAGPTLDRLRQLGVSLCSNRCSGDSDDPSPASGPVLISGPVAEGPIPGRCPAPLQRGGGFLAPHPCSSAPLHATTGGAGKHWKRSSSCFFFSSTPWGLRRAVLRRQEGQLWMQTVQEISL